jgi:hypothetical protein
MGDGYWVSYRFWGIGKGGAKGGGVGKRVGEWEKRYEGCWVLCFLCVFECISVVVEGAYVRDFRELELCTVSTVG